MRDHVRRWSRFAVVVCIAGFFFILGDVHSSPLATDEQDSTAKDAREPNGQKTSRDLRGQTLNVSAPAETPIGPKWWPSRYGADDQRGAANLMNADHVVEAAKLIHTGQTYQLGRVYEREM